MLVEGLLLALVFVVNGEKSDVCVTQSFGKTSPYKITHSYFIRPGQGQAELVLLPDPKCALEKTVGLSVKVCDDLEEPIVKIESDSSFGLITRTEAENATAFVVVSAYCDVQPGPHYLPYVYGEFERSIKRVPPYPY